MNKYFENITEKLKKSAELKIEKGTLVFSTLKILEYWVRILQANPECVNREVAIRLMDEKHTMSFVESVIDFFKHFLKNEKTKKGSKSDENEINSIDFNDDESEYRTDVCCSRLLRAVNRFLDEAKPKCKKKAAANFLKVLQNMDSDDMAPQLYQELQSMTCEHFINYAMTMLRKGISENDPSFKRIQKIKKIYRLNDNELELLIYLWLRESNDLEITESERTFLRHRRFRDNDNNCNSLENISRATILIHIYSFNYKLWFNIHYSVFCATSSGNILATNNFCTDFKIKSERSTYKCYGYNSQCNNLFHHSNTHSVLVQ